MIVSDLFLFVKRGLEKELFAPKNLSAWNADKYWLWEIVNKNSQFFWGDLGWKMICVQIVNSRAGAGLRGVSEINLQTE